ncbi:hypothetical protein ACJX0J_023516, partial [Zea mays]
HAFEEQTHMGFNKDRSTSFLSLHWLRGEREREMALELQKKSLAKDMILLLATIRLIAYAEIKKTDIRDIAYANARPIVYMTHTISITHLCLIEYSTLGITMHAELDPKKSVLVDVWINSKHKFYTMQFDACIYIVTFFLYYSSKCFITGLTAINHSIARRDRASDQQKNLHQQPNFTLPHTRVATGLATT